MTLARGLSLAGVDLLGVAAGAGGQQELAGVFAAVEEGCPDSHRGPGRRSRAGELLHPDAVLVDRRRDASAAKVRYTLVGRLVNSLQEFEHAQADPAVDYVVVGPVFGSPDEVAGPTGLELVAAAAERAPIDDPRSKPWFSLGGVDADNLDDVLEAGARRVGMAAAVTQAPDPRAAARELVIDVNRAWRLDARSDWPICRPSGVRCSHRSEVERWLQESRSTQALASAVNAVRPSAVRSVSASTASAAW